MQEMVGGGRSSLCDARKRELKKVLISGRFGQVVSFLLGSERSLGFITFSGVLFFS